MESVSVTIITRNERHNIRDCLAGVQWANEIVVIDQFSADGTAEIARQCGARVWQEPWHGFAGQKNIALKRARSTWVLSLDADERVTAPLQREIQNTIAKRPKAAGYFIARKNFFCGKWIRHGGWYPDYSLRLFKRDTGRFEERAVHEKVTVSGKTGRLKNPLEHHTYASVSDFLQRLDRYSSLAAHELRKSKPSPSWTDQTLRPAFTFLKMYVFQRGFLDGREGFFLALSYAYYTFLKYYRTATEGSIESHD